MSHEELQELLALYALEALDPGEVAELEAHLATCETCPAELDELRIVAGAIGLAADPVAPPAELRERILAQVAAPRPAARPTAEVIRPAAGFWKPVAALISLAAAAAIVALSMYALGLAERVRAIEGQLAEKRGLAEFLSSADTATVVLAGTDEAPKARLKLAYDRRTGRAFLFGYDLPQPPAGKAYQLWFISGGKPLPGRVFDPGATGHGWWPEEVPADGRDASVFAVTLEPADGVSSPTGPMFLKSVSLS
jgi:anti-sigma-K factor RskA